MTVDMAAPMLGPGFYRDDMPLEDLRPSPLNPRKAFGDIAELAASIREVGIIEPLVARPVNGHYEIVAGGRRYLASQEAGLTVVPCKVLHLSDAQALEIMVIENNQREDVNALEEADGFSRLLKSGYELDRLAERLGRSKKYVYDRMKLMDLAAPAKQLLQQGTITAGHGILLARLKPVDQLRALDVAHGGVFQREGGLTEEEDEAAGDAEAEAEERELRARGRRDKIAAGQTPEFSVRDVVGVKPKSVRETAHWIAEHVRFRPHEAAAAAPLEHGEVEQRVLEAQAKPGRGKKVIPITFNHYIQPEARDQGERTFGPRSFKFADGKPHRDYGDYSRKPTKTCEHSVLGVVAVGEKYGEAFEVCIARDKCQVHWKSEMAERAKNQKLRESGKGAQADRNERKKEESHEARWKREAADRAAREKAWKALSAALLPEIVVQVKATKALTTVHAKFLTTVEFAFDRPVLESHLGKTWFTQPVQAVLLSAAAPSDLYFEDFDDYVKCAAQPLGLDIARLKSIRDIHRGVETKSVQTSAQKKPAKKSAKKKR